jgi:hypothetical protein
MLGLARDDGEILLAALDYLEAWWAELFEQRLAESEGTL